MYIIHRPFKNYTIIVDATISDVRTDSFRIITLEFQIHNVQNCTYIYVYNKALSNLL